MSSLPQATPLTSSSKLSLSEAQTQRVEEENMSPSFHPAALLLFILFLPSSSSSFCARLSATQRGLNIMPIKVSGENSVSVLEVTDPIAKLTGMEDCNNGDEEEYFKRRMTMEAHLDYIYTQHHKP